MSLTAESLKLADCEKAIEQGLVSLGFQLKMIRDERLYRAVGFDTFEKYCQKRWTLRRDYVDRQIAAAGTIAEITQVDEISGDLLTNGQQTPKNERQVRPLVSLPDPGDKRKAWSLAVERAEAAGKPAPTAKIVTEAVKELVEANEITPPPPKAPPKPRREQSKAHPATFSTPILTAIDELLRDDGVVLDPFAGVGKIHQLARPHRRTIGIELEPEWAGKHPDTICGDARNLLALVAGMGVDQIATSPTYGNRMADKHEATDASDRATYRHRLGRPLTDGNTGGMQWGDDYRTLHAAVWGAAVDVLPVGGLFILNIKDHVRGGVVQEVTSWHVSVLHSLGLHQTGVRHVVTSGLAQVGDNDGDRAGVESVIRFEKATR